MQTLTLGIVAAPGLTTTISEKIEDNIKATLNKEIADSANWEIDLKVDHLTGAAEEVNEIMDRAFELKATHDWDYVISLTDLPIFDQGFVVLADTHKNEAAQISLPAFGIMPTARNVKNTMVHMAKELYYTTNNSADVQFLKKGIGIKESNKGKNFYKLMNKVFKFSTLERKVMPEDSSTKKSIRFIIRPKSIGRLKLINGMTMSNRPWSIMPNFKKVIGLAFATGSYMLIFNTLWQLSGLYNYSRFVILMSVAMIAMVTWIIFAHNLWEKKRHYKSNKLRLMYNAATVMTLSVSVFTFYISMFILFSFAVIVFVPGDVFKEVLEHEVRFIDYAKLAWLVTSAATVAGAIGAGLENEEAVRQVTYGYRQYVRSKKVQEEEKEKQEKKEGKTTEKTDDTSE